MSEIHQWNQADASNNDPAKGGWPEGMPPQDVNNRARENLGAARRYYEAPDWRDLLKEGSGFAVSKLTDSSIRVVHNTTPTSAVAKFPVGARIRIGDGSTFVYGFVTSATFSTPNTDVVIDMDGATIVQAAANEARLFLSSVIGRAAFSPIGITLGQDPPQIPSADLLGAAAFKNEGSGNNLDADKVDGFHAADLIAEAREFGRNFIINSGFRTWQRARPINSSTLLYPNSDDTYTADRWLLLSDGNNRVTLDRDGTERPAGVSRYSLHFEGAAPTGSPNSEKFGVLQILEGKDAFRLIGNQVTLSFYAKAGRTWPFRSMILAWDSTEDVVTSDIVSLWNAEAVDPTPVAGWFKQGSAGIHSLTTGWVRYSITATISQANATNVAVFLWSEEKDYATGEDVWITGVQLELGDAARDYAEASMAEEMANCQRFFAKTANQDVAVRGVGAGGAVLGHAGGSTYVGFCSWRFPQEMRAVPGATGSWNPDTGTATQWSDGSVATISEIGTGGMNLVSDNDVTARYLHAFADAEL